ncbi:MAG: TolC family protein [Bryobacteraceae bacterium]|jgi:outer membrane protein TolC
MRKSGLLVVFFLGMCQAEVHTLTMREAVARALKESPDVVLARLEEQRAAQAARLAHAVFVPRVVVGSGAALSDGFPMSIEGSAPSIFQANAISSVFNRAQSLRVAAAKESRRGAEIDANAKQEEVVYRTAEMFLDAESAARIAEMSRQEADELGRVLDAVRARAAEGRELPIEVKKAELNLARARYRSQVLESNAEAARISLATLLAFEPSDQVRPAPGERTAPAVPESADAAIQAALASSKEIRSLESKLLAKQLDVRSQQAERLPRLDLVAQYAVLSKFNNYAKYFNAFQRNNAELGVSFQVPLFSGPSVSAAVAQAGTEAAEVRVQLRAAQSRVAADARRTYEDMRQAETAKEISKMDLDVARDQVSVLLAQMEEGRASLRQVDEARTAETDKWVAFYDAAANAEKARLAVLRQTGELLAALR